MVHEPVHGGRTHERVREHTGSFAEVTVWGDDRGSLFVAFTQYFIEVILLILDLRPKTGHK